MNETAREAGLAEDDAGDAQISQVPPTDDLSFDDAIDEQEDAEPPR